MVAGEVEETTSSLDSLLCGGDDGPTFSTLGEVAGEAVPAVAALDFTTEDCVLVCGLLG